MSSMANLLPHATGQAAETVPRQRVRVMYEKGESIKFISHQDEFRAWERALRRSGLPLLYKQGFNPQPFIQFASPLGVGFSGARELVDITFSPPVSLDELGRRIKASLPPGLSVRSLAEVDLKSPALQSLLIGADYSLTILAEQQEITSLEIERRIADFLASPQCWRTRERKKKLYRYNLRPLIFELQYAGYSAADEAHSIFLRVQQREGATGRPDEVVSALGLDCYARSLCRERLYFSNRAEDAAQFSLYPVILKEDVAEVPSGRPGRKRMHADARRKGSSISERAADEFD